MSDKRVVDASFIIRLHPNQIEDDVAREMVHVSLPYLFEQSRAVGNSPYLLAWSAVDCFVELLYEDGSYAEHRIPGPPQYPEED